MKILLINSHHKIIGGTERYYIDLGNLLISKGHEVAYFSMVDKGNIKSKWSKYFVSFIDIASIGTKNSIKKLFRMLYSLEAKSKISKLLNDFKPDIVHINNIYLFISPSILGEIKKMGIPIVQTIHDFQLVSPIPNLYYQNKICESTKKHNFYKALANRRKGPYITTFLSVMASYTQYLFKFFEKNVNYFIVPSKFIQKKLTEYDFVPKNIIHIPNFTSIGENKLTKMMGKYVLFFGRLDEAKGILFLLKVIKALPKIQFRILGNYANLKIRKDINGFIKDNLLKNVKIVSHKSGTELIKIIRNSRFIIVPSLWYENQPYSILESFALGKAVVGSKIGGIPEIIKNKSTGLLFRPGDIEDCRKKILALWDNHKTLVRMEKNVLHNRMVYNPEIHYKKIVAVYKKVIYENKN